MAMKTVSEVLGTESEGMEFQASDGKKHIVKPLNLKMMGKFEKWLESRALKTIMDQREILADEFGAAISAVSADIVSGKYAFGSKPCQDALQSVHGAICLIGLMLGVTETRAKWLLENDAVNLKIVMDQVIAESMPEKDQKELSENPPVGVVTDQ